MIISVVITDKMTLRPYVVMIQHEHCGSGWHYLSHKPIGLMLFGMDLNRLIDAIQPAYITLLMENTGRDCLVDVVIKGAGIVPPIGGYGNKI